MADSDTPVVPGDDGLSVDRAGEFVKQVEEFVMNEPPPGAVADSIIGAGPTVVPQEAPPQAPRQQPSPEAPPIAVPRQPERPWWAWPLAAVVMFVAVCVCVTVIVIIIDGSGADVVENAGASTSPTPSPAEASAAASESPNPEEATSAAAPFELSPDPSSGPSTPPGVPALYDGEFLGLPQLNDAGAAVVWVELDGEAPQVYLEEPEDTDGIDFDYYRDDLTYENNGIYSWSTSQMGDLIDGPPSEQSCADSVRSNPMNNPRHAWELYEKNVLCVITSEGNIAAMKVTYRGDTFTEETPAINFEVTLWSQQ